MKSWKIGFILVGSMLISPLSMAWEDPCCNEYSRFLPDVFTLAGGNAFSSDLSASTDYSQGFTQFDFDGNHETKTRAVYGGSIGKEFELRPRWDLQVAIAYYQTAPFTAKGIVNQGVTPAASNDLEYHYDVVSRQLLVEGKLLMDWRKRWYPYISLGIGAAFNKAKNYEVDVLPPLTLSPVFDDETKTSFTYNVGAGVDYSITERLRLGVGYRFTDWGRVGLGEGEIGTPGHFFPVPKTLSQSHVYAQEVIAQLSYIL